MAWKPDQLKTVCRLSKNISVEYEIYKDSKSFNRLEFRKGRRYLFDLIEEDDQTIAGFLRDLKQVWSGNPANDNDLTFMNKILLWFIGGKIISSSSYHNVNFLTKNKTVDIVNTTSGKLMRKVSWTAYKLKRGDLETLVLLNIRQADSVSNMGRSKKLTYNWVKLKPDDLKILIPALEKLVNKLSRS